MAYTYDQLVILAENAGFTGQSAQTAAAIALAESSGNPDNINYNDPGGSYGLMQINQNAHPGTATEALDPQGSFNLAYQISQEGQDFSPWSTYNSGAYLNDYPAGLSIASITPMSDTSPDLSVSDTLNTDTGGDQGIVATAAIPMTSGQGVSAPIANASLWTIPQAIEDAVVKAGNTFGNDMYQAALQWLERGGVMLLGIVLVLAGIYYLAATSDTGKAALAAVP